ncbi:MAG: glutamyl-tRNA amidotransferase [Clostridiales bacterium]|nr:MAG: glutamyl-tRNA amidotransferase [Clostridiales bacterium]
MKLSKKAKLLFAAFCAFVLAFGISTVAYAADDPLTVVSNLSEFLFGLIRAIGLILLAFGVLQIGMSLKSHDPSARANGMLTLAGGIIITFTKEILTLITG